VTRADGDGRVIIEVSDTGAGIPGEALPRIFDPFFTTKPEGGVGLGLSISHGTVKAMGGELQAESAPGRGSLLRVILPVAKAYRAAAPSGVLPLRQAGPRRRVLVIDDEPMVGHALARVLADESDVEVLTEARGALALIAAGSFDLVLCDLMMPVMTGMDLFAEVVRKAPRMAGRIVFMTGGAFTPRARAFLESVSNPCLEKPIDVGRLRSLVARAGEPTNDRNAAGRA